METEQQRPVRAAGNDCDGFIFFYILRLESSFDLFVVPSTWALFLVINPFEDLASVCRQEERVLTIKAEGFDQKRVPAQQQ
jgi:hypothetical protein